MANDGAVERSVFQDDVAKDVMVGCSASEHAAAKDLDGRAQRVGACPSVSEHTMANDVAVEHSVSENNVAKDDAVECSVSEHASAKRTGWSSKA